MNETTRPSITSSTTTSRREFLTRTSQIVAGAALAGVKIPHVHAAEDNTIRLALIGSGSRGSGAVVNAFDVAKGPIKLYVMADFFEDRLARSMKTISSKHADKVDVPPERQFPGFDGWRKAIDCLRPGSGDIAMLTGYAGWRPGQLEYAVARGVNVFMEKSFATDPVGVRRVIKASEEADKKGLKIAAGLMCRHSKNRQELIKRIKGGALGKVQLIRAYRMEPSGWLPPRKPEVSDLEWQIRNFTKFLWVSGGLWAEMDIHQIDELCWLKDMWPVSAHGVGGRVANSTDCSQNLDSFSVEWTFPDGTKAYDVVRYIRGCHNEFATYVHGTKCAAQFSGNIHAGTVHIYKDQRCSLDNIGWRAPKETLTPWEAQWTNLQEAIRKNKPFNEGKRAAYSNLADIMGRAAVHMGKVITWEEAMNSNFQWCPNIDNLTKDSEPPIKADAQGRYPVPIPGQWTEI
jgi:predicted dehydrogenase